MKGDGSVGRMIRPSLVLYGAKLADVWRFGLEHDDVCNINGLVSTDIADMDKTFGVEAAQAMWGIAVKNNARPNIASTHITLLGSIVFSSGSFQPLKPATVKSGAGGNFMDALQDRSMHNIASVVGLRGVRDDLRGIGAQMMGVATTGRGSCVCDVQCTEDYARKWMADVQSKMAEQETMDFGVESDEEEQEDDVLVFGDDDDDEEEEEAMVFGTSSEGSESGSGSGSERGSEDEEVLDFDVDPEEDLLGKMTNVGIKSLKVSSPKPPIDPRFFPKHPAAAASMQYCGTDPPRVEVKTIGGGAPIVARRILEASGHDVEYNMREVMEEVVRQKDEQAELKALEAAANDMFNKGVSELGVNDVDMATLKVTEMHRQRRQRTPSIGGARGAAGAGAGAGAGGGGGRIAQTQRMNTLQRIQDLAKRKNVHLHISRRTQQLAVQPLQPHSPILKPPSETMRPAEREHEAVAVELVRVPKPKKTKGRKGRGKKTGDMVDLNEFLA
jgi:hypothetical protein